jgi:hypothetical protein
MSERQFAFSGQWALGADELQWILYRRRSRDRGGWRGVSFVRSERVILERCMREKGVLEHDRAVLLAGPPETFDLWKASQSSSNGRGRASPAEREAAA